MKELPPQAAPLLQSRAESTAFQAVVLSKTCQLGIQASGKRMSGPARIALFSALGAGVAYTAFHQGGTAPSDWNLALLTVGVAGIVHAISAGHAGFRSRQRAVVAAALLFPAYVVFQLVPLPLAVVRILSPVRAEIASALAGI